MDDVPSNQISWVQHILDPYEATHGNNISLLQDQFSLHVHNNSTTTLYHLGIEVDYIPVGCTCQSCNEWARVYINHWSSMSERRATHGWWLISKEIPQQGWTLQYGWNAPGTLNWYYKQHLVVHWIPSHVSTLGTMLSWLSAEDSTRHVNIIATSLGSSGVSLPFCYICYCHSHSINYLALIIFSQL